MICTLWAIKKECKRQFKTSIHKHFQYFSLRENHGSKLFHAITVKFSGAKLKSHRHFFNFGFLLEILITIEIQTFSDCLGLQVKFWHNLKILSRYESKSSVQVYLALWQIDKGTLIVLCVFQIYSSFVRF